MPEANDIIAAVEKKNWIGLAIIIVAVLVRLTKSDTKIPINIPARWRPWLAMGLGATAGVLMKVSAGMSWRAAALSGLLAGAIPIIGQNLFINSLANGKEIPVPGLMQSPAVDKDAVAPVLGSSQRPPPIVAESDIAAPEADTAKAKVPTTPPLPIIMLLAFLVGLIGCTPGQKQAAKTALDVASYACILANAGADDATISKLCAIEADLAPAMKELLKQHRIAAKRVAAPAGPCTSSTATPSPSASVK